MGGHHNNIHQPQLAILAGKCMMFVSELLGAARARPYYHPYRS